MVSWGKTFGSLALAIISVNLIGSMTSWGKFEHGWPHLAITLCNKFQTIIDYFDKNNQKSFQSHWTRTNFPNFPKTQKALFCAHFGK